MNKSPWQRCVSTCPGALRVFSLIFTTTLIVFIVHITQQEPARTERLGKLPPAFEEGQGFSLLLSLNRHGSVRCSLLPLLFQAQPSFCRLNLSDRIHWKASVS